MRSSFRLNSLTKFLTVAVYCVILFIVDDLVVLAGLFVIPFVMYVTRFRVSRFVMIFAVIIFGINAFFIEGDLSYKVEYALRIVLRFLGIVFSGMLFSREDPNEFAHALMNCGLPYRYGMTMVLTFRLIPLFSTESMMIKKAQMARGINLEGVSSLLNSVRYTFFPWIYSALERADALTLSMEGRCFGIYRKRTFRKQSVFSLFDYAWILFMAAALAGAGWWSL
ncbi:MAG: energy-coupling factor transporter transmembrane protein EcfT [Theionarchaea archaeon]|nr:energy-coupling factor transporter transmembrane protein EcfT [Theionarchaea archaeon]MBU6999811.1 energy-coupling factor transporter transmembrane protein EcfT [Theionarchaea archaeon]MBU7020231.1 energy-coupling factor transporter transmembrane protein EcfT [Theionarchaea archaeon]MBU7033650.1 energy-coupling factor transporter transmembrane protein EcfT [Theionarchaea archaeon]MBU7040089.1 energy-coupling factor transporter transmembrane protein EcfT [Theionarchaea archaeon]